MRVCEVCGIEFIDMRGSCPACGSPVTGHGEWSSGRQVEGLTDQPRSRGREAGGPAAGAGRADVPAGPPPVRGEPMRPPPADAGDGIRRQEEPGPGLREEGGSRGQRRRPVDRAAPGAGPAAAVEAAGAERRRRARSLGGTARAALVLSVAGLVLSAALPWFVAWSTDADDPGTTWYDARLRRVVGDEPPARLSGGYTDLMQWRIWFTMASLVAGAVVALALIWLDGRAGGADRPDRTVALSMLVAFAGVAVMAMSASFIALSISNELTMAFSESAEYRAARGVSPAGVAAFVVGLALATRAMLCAGAARAALVEVELRRAVPPPDGGTTALPGDPWAAEPRGGGPAEDGGGDKGDVRIGLGMRPPAWTNGGRVPRGPREGPGGWVPPAGLGRRPGAEAARTTFRASRAARLMLVACVVGLVCVPLFPWVAVQVDHEDDGGDFRRYEEEAVVHAIAREVSGDELDAISFDILAITVALALAAAFSAVAYAGAVRIEAGGGDVMALIGGSAALFAVLSLLAHAMLFSHVVHYGASLEDGDDFAASAGFGGNIAPLVCSIALLI
ncbi:MAG: hypothetical protein L0Z54_00765, partial [Thermoplasmata archaeon]|nr:hypothetical protein [Thermoplasmata archaeon]